MANKTNNRPIIGQCRLSNRCTSNCIVSYNTHRYIHARCGRYESNQWRSNRSIGRPACRLLFVGREPSARTDKLVQRRVLSSVKRSVDTEARKHLQQHRNTTQTCNQTSQEWVVSAQNRPFSATNGY